MSSSSQLLPANVWTSKVLPAPKTADALSQISHFLSELGYSKTVKALKKEATSNDVELNEDFTPNSSLGPLGQTLGDLYVDAFLNEEDDTDDEDEEDSEEEKAGAEDATSDEDSSSDSDSSESDSEDEKPAHSKVKKVKEEPVTSTKRKREASPESSDSDSSSSDASSDADSESDSDSDDSDSSVEPPKKKSKVENTKIVNDDATDATSDSDSSDSDSDSSVMESQDESEATSDSDSSSDSSSDDSSDDDDTETEAKAKKPAKKTTTILGKVSDALGKVSSALGRKPSDSADSEQSSTTLIASPQEVQTSTPVSTMHPARQQRLDDSADNTFGNGRGKNNVPFSRIPKDTKVDPRFASNDYVSYDYADRAYQDLVVTKGKGFTKEKNKKKRGSYRGGIIDTTPKGIKFED